MHLAGVELPRLGPEERHADKQERAEAADEQPQLAARDAVGHATGAGADSRRDGLGDVERETCSSASVAATATPTVAHRSGSSKKTLYESECTTSTASTPSSASPSASSRLRTSQQS